MGTERVLVVCSHRMRGNVRTIFLLQDDSKYTVSSRY
jgi:hypothetical protein